MRVLAACEESQEVCKAFRALGHEAYSCDIQPCSGGHPEWHILGDALKAIEGGKVTTMDGQTHDVGKWDLIIAFPPCTKTSNAGARHLYRGGNLNIKRYYEGLCGKALFLAIWAADCEKVVIENPTPSKVFDYPEPTQAVQPINTGIRLQRKPCCGSAASNRWSRPALWSRRKPGAQVGATAINTRKSTKECLQRIEPKTAQRHSPALPAQWQNSGGEFAMDDVNLVMLVEMAKRDKGE